MEKCVFDPEKNELYLILEKFPTNLASYLENNSNSKNFNYQKKLDICLQITKNLKELH